VIVNLLINDILMAILLNQLVFLSSRLLRVSAIFSIF